MFLFPEFIMNKVQTLFIFNEVKPNALGMSFRVERDMQFQFFFYVCDGYIVPEVPEAQV